VRKAAYWAVLSGACGHTYGHRSFILWVCKGERLRFGADIPWYESLDAPGALDMAHLKSLLIEHGFSQLAPDQALIVSGAREGTERAVAARAGGRNWGMAYLPVGQPVEVDPGRLGERVKAWWFDPREDIYREIGLYDQAGSRSFRPPCQGPGCDWVLLLGREPAER